MQIARKFKKNYKKLPGKFRIIETAVLINPSPSGSGSVKVFKG
jgi:hypothetical protein